MGLRALEGTRPTYPPFPPQPRRGVGTDGGPAERERAAGLCRSLAEDVWAARGMWAAAQREAVPRLAAELLLRRAHPPARFRRSRRSVTSLDHFLRPHPSVTFLGHIPWSRPLVTSLGHVP